MCLLSITIASIASLPIKNVIIDAPNIASEAPATIANITDQEIMKQFDADRINNTKLLLRNQVRPGMSVTSYAVKIEANINADTFTGRLAAQVIIDDHSTREDDIVFQVHDLTVDSVTFSFAGGSVFLPADFNIDDDNELLEISTGYEATLYSFIIEYRGSLSMIGDGLYTGRYGNGE
ncbi:unnamed protein product [Parnassius apollo]|uniref:(apollo) hypothetical protein n=1 Tax=Parnassius apollo TaxID=110799 RepID=A0A8S3Y0I5_PARAO|nr:unnamed protein product [Parnassius apollo]